MNTAALIAAIIGLVIGIGGTFAFLSPVRRAEPTLSLTQDSSFMMRGNETAPLMMGNIDRHFIEQMIPHHEDAIQMAEIALRKAEHAEIKTLAENIKKAQSEENAQMRAWYKSWFGTDVPLSSMGMGRGMGMMMHGGMMGDATDVRRLETARPFDKAFIEEMIPHHQMAIMMANMLLAGTTREEMRTLGEAIIKAQSTEIEQMRGWYQRWYPS